MRPSEAPPPGLPSRTREITLLVLIVTADYVPAPLTTGVLVALAGWYVVQRGLRVPARLPALLWLPALLVILGLPGFLFHDPVLALKDLWRFANYPLVIALGYLAAQRFGRLGRSLRPFVVAAGVACALYVIARASGQELPLALGPFRQEYGRAPFSSLVGVVVLAMAQFHGIRVGLSRFVRGVVFALCVAALVMSQSRTLIGSALFVVIWLGILRWSGVVRGVAITALAAAAWLVIPWLSRGVDTPEWASLGARTQSTIQELTRSTFRDRRDIARYWRAYEATVAWRSFQEGSPLQLAIGRGFGEQLDLGRTMVLGAHQREWRAIPVLHNAFLYLLLKTGIAGLALHLLFLATLAWRGAQPAGEARAARRLLFLLGVCLLAWSMVISGVFQRHGPFVVLLLMGTLAAHLDRPGTVSPARTSP